MTDNRAFTRGEIVEVWGTWGNYRFGIVLGQTVWSYPIGSPNVHRYHEVLVGTQKLACFKMEDEDFLRPTEW